MDVKDIAKLAFSPLTLAAVGGFLGNRYGKKVSIGNKYVATGVGLGAGYLLGRIVQSVLPATTAPAAAPSQVQQQPQGDFVDIGPAQQTPLLPWPTSPANVSEGEGSYGNTSYDVSGTEQAMAEAQELLRRRNSHG